MTELLFPGLSVSVHTDVNLIFRFLFHLADKVNFYCALCLAGSLPQK